jgi:hypothetical protein
VSCVACGGVIIWIGATQPLEGPPVVFCACGIGGLWKRLKSVEEFFVACSFRNVKNGFSWAFAGVYEPNLDGDRRLL